MRGVRGPERVCGPERVRGVRRPERVCGPERVCSPEWGLPRGAFNVLCTHESLQATMRTRLVLLRTI